MNLRLPLPLRLPTLWFAASLLLGSSVFYLALDARMASKTRQIASQRTADMAAHDLRRTPERQARSHVQSATYTRLHAAGFFGDEDRLDWLSSLARLRGSMDLQQVTWRLSPRAPSSLSPGLYSSTMVFEIVPIDAHRLALFQEQLRAQAHGRFTLSKCTLQPDAGGQQGTANCTLDWWTWNGG